MITLLIALALLNQPAVVGSVSPHTTPGHAVVSFHSPSAVRWELLQCRQQCSVIARDVGTSMTAEIFDTRAGDEFIVNIREWGTVESVSLGTIPQNWQQHWAVVPVVKK
jgi:hypothetical protein